MSFKIATYNVLADCYINPSWYPHTTSDYLDPKNRIPAVVNYLIRLDADILCLQEVEHHMFSNIDKTLSPLGYRGIHSLKNRMKKDGCAIFFRTRSFELLKFFKIDYPDQYGGLPDSGHIGQLLVLEYSGRLLALANTHLKWDAPATPSAKRYGMFQITHLLAEIEGKANGCSGVIICGDLNVTPDDEVILAMHRVGFQYSHQNCDYPTCNSNQQAQTLDYLLYNPAIKNQPILLTVVANDTPLPGGNEPSDHIAVLAQMEWCINI